MTDTAASSGQRAADENAKRAVRLLNGGPEETPGTLARRRHRGSWLPPRCSRAAPRRVPEPAFPELR